MLGIVIPTFNAAAELPGLLAQLPPAARIIVADGGSTDETLRAAIAGGAVIATGASGRGQQLSLGASHAADTKWLLFLHADNRLPDDWEAALQRHISRHPKAAGYFHFRADAPGWKARWLDICVAMRCQWWGLPYGDQGLLISRAMYDALGGYQDMALFEDVDMIDRIKAQFGRTRLRAMGGAMRVNIDKHLADGIFARGRRNLALLKAYRAGEDITALQQRYKS